MAPQPLPAANPQLLRSFAELPGRRIGIFGGSFDPPHAGHLQVARESQRAFGLDAVVFVPAKQNPLKNAAPQATDIDRIDMALAAVREEPSFFVSPADLARSGPSYAIDLLREARAQVRGDVELFFIVGADCLPDLHRWREAADLFAIARFIVASRDGFTGKDLDQKTPALTDAQREQLRIGLLPGIAEPSASRRIRAEIAQGTLPAEGLPLSVRQIISERGLYGWKNE